MQGNCDLNILLKKNYRVPILIKAKSSLSVLLILSKSILVVLNQVLYGHHRSAPNSI